MNYSQLQLEAIKLFGKKELSNYCLVKVDGKYIYHRDKSILENHYEILGHIPHLEDVFRVSEEKGFYVSFEKWIDLGLVLFIQHNGSIDRLKFNPSITLIEQSEETLTQLINLFK